MDTVDALISPQGSLDILTLEEVELLQKSTCSGLYDLFRQCCLAVLNCGNDEDDIDDLLARNKPFEVEIVRQPRGALLQLYNAPASAFVNGEIILGIKENIFAVLRDIVYTHNHLFKSSNKQHLSGAKITNLVFQILRHAQALAPRRTPKIVVCWGGHSINHGEYKYTKQVGYELGLRGHDICTGCGPGAMKGPMKGAHIAHAKQRCQDYRYIGISEPGIIAAESPNPMVNELIIMPDIEKRLEAFVRLGHAFVVFPGGVGTAEEILYLLGILLHPSNSHITMPLIFTGPSQSADYFAQIDTFIGATLGPDAQSRYEIIIDNATQVANTIHSATQKVAQQRQSIGDAFHFNWQLHIEEAFQLPFVPTHKNMAALNLTQTQPANQMAANLRKAMSGIVAGNVKQFGIEQVRKYGPYCLQAEAELMAKLDNLLQSFVDQQRMKLPSSKGYVPCYKVQ
jgi:hypothetical protein